MITAPTSSEITLRAPAKPGAYRLFTYVFDGKGHAGHANIPFYVDAAERGTPTAAPKPPVPHTAQ